MNEVGRDYELVQVKGVRNMIGGCLRKPSERNGVRHVNMGPEKHAHEKRSGCKDNKRNGGSEK